MSQPDHVRIFDTTLRDGEQSPGATMTSSEKLEVAKTLSRLGVDIIEAGFAAASPDDLLAVRGIAEGVGMVAVEGRPVAEPPRICSLARAATGDIDKAWEAVSPAKHPRIHTFLATSPIHREHKLRMSKAEVLSKITEMVTYARGLCADIEFSPEDAGRTEMEFLYEAIQAAIEAGASTINIPDTVGYTTPDEFGERIALIHQNVVGVERAIISVHCHNDLGLAVANSLAALQNGARQVEVAVNGIGERAGNASLEEIVMALKVRHDRFKLTTTVDSTQLTRISRLVSKVTGMSVQPNKAIVGANAFAHEAGIHQDGMLKNQETYEIMRPETVGAAARASWCMGKHSGRAAFANRLADLGYPIPSQVELYKRLLRRVQEARRQEEAHHGRRPVGPGERRAVPARRAVSPGRAAGHLRHRHAHRHRAPRDPGRRAAHRVHGGHGPCGRGLHGHPADREHPGHAARVQRAVRHARHRRPG
jgi:2-isopropylmalate synthase